MILLVDILFFDTIDFCLQFDNLLQISKENFHLSLSKFTK